MSSSSLTPATSEVLTSHKLPAANVLDSADAIHSQHHRKLYWTVLV